MRVNAKLNSQATYSIAAVSKLSGVSCHTLRVWERRYGFPVPQRLESGHRRYSADQVNIICQVARQSRSGGSIAQHIAEAREGAFATVESEISPTPTSDELISEILAPLTGADLEATEESYQRVTSGLSEAEIATQILTPALTESGERLFRKDCTLVDERLASMFFMRKLASLLDEVQGRNTRPIGRVIVLVMQGDRHEGGALMLSLALELAGWRSLFLGADLPVREVQRGIDTWKPAAVGVSLSLSRNIRKRFDELSRLQGAPIFVGGRSALNYQSLARRCGLAVVLGPAIPNVANYIQSLNSSGQEAKSSESVSGDRPIFANSGSFDSSPKMVRVEGPGNSSIPH